MIDRDAVDNTSKSIGLQECDFSEHSIWISEKDLEEEYTKALDAGGLWTALQNSNTFSKNELNNIKHADANGLPTKTDIAAFLRSKSKYKIQAIVVANLLDETTASKITSIMNLLSDIENA